VSEVQEIKYYHKNYIKYNVVSNNSPKNVMQRLLRYVTNFDNVLVQNNYNQIKLFLPGCRRHHNNLCHFHPTVN
jgi:hypothetical protein